MTELLSNLPEELKSKVFTFQRHPVAELYMKRKEEGDQCMRKHLAELKEYFPHLEEEDMKRRKKSDQWPGMCMFWVMLFRDPHKEVFRWVVSELKENTSMPQNAFLFFDFLRYFVKKHKDELFKRTPEEALEWCKENVGFTDGEDEEDEEEEESE
jgi:hypothetical protein